MVAGRKMVVVVEDVGSCATTLEIALGRIHHLDIRVVHSAEAARAVINSDGAVCAVVTDLHLPQSSGQELIRWIRSRRESVHLPIIVVSGDSDPDTPSKTLLLGANAFFPKPFSPSEVRRRLEDLINAEQNPTSD